jgi:hypothetical protein
MKLRSMVFKNKICCFNINNIETGNSYDGHDNHSYHDLYSSFEYSDYKLLKESFIFRDNDQYSYICFLKSTTLWIVKK